MRLFGAFLLFLNAVYNAQHPEMVHLAVCRPMIFGTLRANSGSDKSRQSQQALEDPRETTSLTDRNFSGFDF